MDIIRQRPALIAVAAFILGFAIGLFAFGWGLTPVEYTGAGPQHLFDEDQRSYLVALADLYAFDNNQARVQEALKAWPESDQAICELAAASTDQAEAARLTALATVANQGLGCAGAGLSGDPEDVDEGGGLNLGSLVLLCGLLLVLALVGAGLFYVLQRRRSVPIEDLAGDTLPAAPMAGDGDGEQSVIPLARFQTTYNLGHDAYDDSFSIEDGEANFLGECGVGISETISADEPKNVTAFEVWLFDKNDIRTVTKVVMSDHAFFDEAIKAKLAPKGEPVLARPNETIVLETASLIINAEITDMEYGVGGPDPQSFFDRFTVELSAWAKEGDFGETDVQDHIDEMLEF